MGENNSEVIYVISVPPSCCPMCARGMKWDRLAREDFFAGATQQCPDCGAKFQYVRASVIENTALKAGGEL